MIIKIKLVDLARLIEEAQLHGNGNIVITRVASIYSAKAGDITFLKDYRFRDQLNICTASAIILSKDDLVLCPSNIAALVVKNPYLAYIKIAQLLNTTPKFVPNIASGAIIAPDAILGKRVGIGSNTVIESGVLINDDVKIGSGSFIGKNTKLGAGTYLCSNVTVYHDIEIGEYCMIQSGSVIGSDGFGYIKNDNMWVKIPQLGKVKIGNHVEIGSCTTVDRGTLDDTHIRDGVIIDNQCHIAHNVVIGENTAIAGGVVMAGSLIIGKNCMIGGASVINGHIRICDNVIITGMSMVIKSITIPGTYSSGIPIQPNAVWRRNTALVMRIKNIHNRINVIEQRLENFYDPYFKIIKIFCCFILLGLLGLMLLMRFF